MNKINNNLIVFESSPDFADNSRGFWEYIRKNTHFETFWIIKNKKLLPILKKQNIPCALHESNEAKAKIDEAHYFITSSFEFAYHKKIGQIHLSLWHGFPLKLIGFFDSASSTTDFQNLKVITTQTDLLSATSQFAQLTLSGQFSLDPRKVKITGYPRNDLMLNCDALNELSKITNIDLENSHLFLYLPTMRKGLKNEGKQFSENIFNYDDYDLKELDCFLNKTNSYIFVKLHFADYHFFKNSDFDLPQRIIFIEPDILEQNLLTIYHILNAFEALITDYSSIYVDYLLLNKPILFSCPDLEIYKKDRGFIVDDPQLLMPGQLIKNQEALLNALQDILNEKDKYYHQRKQSIAFFHRYLDNQSSKRLLDEMLKIDVYHPNDINKLSVAYFKPKSTPLYQYKLNACAEFYFDDGYGFSEQNKKEIYYNAYNPQVHFEIELPKNVLNIRFDPDINGRWVISDLNISINNQLVEYNVCNILNFEGDFYLIENDPQIHIPNRKNGNILTIQYKCKDINEDIIFLIHKQIQLKKQNKNLILKLHNMESSKSWQITRPLRQIKNILKKLKNT